MPPFFIPGKNYTRHYSRNKPQNPQPKARGHPLKPLKRKPRKPKTTLNHLEQPKHPRARARAPNLPRNNTRQNTQGENTRARNKPGTKKLKGRQAATVLTSIIILEVFFNFQPGKR